MFEKALRGSKGYWAWLIILLGIVGWGFFNYLHQWKFGLGITGMSRDVSWGLYIGQFTFLVGVAASAVMLVLPYYLHNYKTFGKITILGEFVAVPAVIMCLSFVLLDLGRIDRAMNMILYPTPNSVLFWDAVVLSGYLFLNIFVGWTVLGCEQRGAPPPWWIKPFIYLSIPWAVSIHTVTAFLIAGLAARGFWLTAVMAPRFLASAFAAGPALVILLCYIVKKVAGWDAGKEAIRAAARIVTYAMVVSAFLVVCELFTVYYSQIPEHMNHFNFLFMGLHGQAPFTVSWWLFIILGLIALVLLLIPQTRNSDTILPIACVLTFLSLWIEKGFLLIIIGFIPSPLEDLARYVPTFPEMSISLGVWGLGALILTILYKVAVGVRKQLET